MLFRLSILLCLSLNLNAFSNFDQVKKTLIKQVYNTPELMKTFYCNQEFHQIIVKGKETLKPKNYVPITPLTKKGKENYRADAIEWEHIVPAEYFGKQLKECLVDGVFIGRKKCRKISPKFNRMEADPMNLVPAIGEINADRSNFRFSSENPPKNSKYKRCGIHIDKDAKKTHVPDRLKGQVARAYLHMEKTYGMKLSKQEKKLFKAWDKEFPMTAREKAVQSKKHAALKKHEADVKKRNASLSRKTASKARLGKPNSINTETQLKSASSRINMPSGLSSSVTKSTTRKGIAKGAIVGAAQYIPYVGIAAQIAWDAYLGYKIEMHDEKITYNEKNIQLNAEYISRLQQESELLGIKIDNNTYKITELTQGLFSHTEQLAVIDEQLSTLTLQMVSVQTLANKNAKAIQEMKDSVFISGTKKLNEYYKSNTTQYLGNAIGYFDRVKDIDNSAVEHLAAYYRVITRYEQYLNPNPDTNIDHELQKMEESYKELAKYVSIYPQYLGLLNSAYMAISDFDKDRLKSYRDILNTVTKEVVNQHIKVLHFDEALDVAENYLVIVDTNKSNEVYLKAYEEKIDNLEKNKKFTSVDNALNVLKKNQNSLLNEAVVRYLYNENSFDNAIKLLQTKRFDNAEFRIKAFVSIYDYMGKKKDLQSLVQLIINNPTYSAELKNKVRKYL